MVCGLTSRANRIVSLVSPGRPRMNVPCTVIPSSRQSAANRRARSTRSPFLMLMRICWFPDSVTEVSSPTRTVYWPSTRAMDVASAGTANWAPNFRACSIARSASSAPEMPDGKPR